jgi:2',3'-cyclic-nucleotide 2'-phosphodiesterase (5'-nucleotidase family)
VLIAVTHDGVPDDQRLVHETTGIDAVVGGDSHTYLYQPLAWKNAAGQEVPIVQDGEFGVRLGRFNLSFEGDAAHGWRLAHYDDELLPVNGGLKPDQRVAALVERYARPLDVRVGEIGKIGATPQDRLALTAQTLAEAWKAAAGTDVGLQPEGVLFEVFRTPAVTRFQVHAIVPFHDTIWKGEISGAKLQALLAKPTLLGGMMHATIDAATIDPARTYTVATTDFVAQVVVPGGADTHRDARDAIEAWLKSGR